MSKKVFIGTDSGATTTKFCAVWENGEPVSSKGAAQRSTSSEKGREAVIHAWISGVDEFLAQNNLQWSQVQGVGLSIPGPYERYGVWSKTPNLPASFSGWDVYSDYKAALSQQVGHDMPLVTGNDGNYGGVAEAQIARGKTRTTVAMLMPGSGLGCAFVDANGLPLDGDTRWLASKPVMRRLRCICSGLTGKPFSCGCGRDWGCYEAYTTISGLPQLLAEKIKNYPDHELATSTLPRPRRKFFHSAPARKRAIRWRWISSTFKRASWACSSPT